MTTAIEVLQLQPQRLLVKRTTCGHEEIGAAFGKAIHQVGECFRESGATMASMPMAVYLDWRDSDCDIGVGCKVDGDVSLTHGCEWLEVPGGPHVYAGHFGTYDSLHETHKAVREWCAVHRKDISGPCFEAYPTDPGNEPDSSKWQTDVYYPL